MHACSRHGKLKQNEDFVKCDVLAAAEMVKECMIQVKGHACCVFPFPVLSGSFIAISLVVHCTEFLSDFHYKKNQWSEKGILAKAKI